MAVCAIIVWKTILRRIEMTVVAVKTRVLFTRKEAEKQTASGIVLSNPNQEQNPLGYVHSIGPDVNIPGLEVDRKSTRLNSSH